MSIAKLNENAYCRRSVGIQMGKSTKTAYLREKMREDIKRSKQSTLDKLPKPRKTEPIKANEPKQKKQIMIAEPITSIRQDELVLRLGFRLLPSRTAFSRVTANLYFDEQKIDTLQLRIIQGPLATNDFEFSSVLGMQGISAGQHTLRVEMHELWSSGEKLAGASKEVAIEYVPLKKEDRLIKVPIIKSINGVDLAIVSGAERKIYREIEENMKKEASSRRDSW